jgi:predicted RNase H-like nuclease
MTLVLGVDGCRGGWCVVAIETHTLEILEACVSPTFDSVLALPSEVIGVDIPIGLLDRPGQRACDVEARRLLGRRRASSVFPAPCRRALYFTDYRTASDANFQSTGRRLSKQSFNITPKIRQMDDRPDSLMQRMVEVHPELCFWALNGGAPLASKKDRVVGRIERWEILRRLLPTLSELPPRSSELPEGCEPDDYIDALVCAWTAVCVARGKAQRIPAQPEFDGRGMRMEMWFPAT